MTFNYVQLGPEQAAAVLARVRGPVLNRSGYCAVDHEADAILIDLGGRPNLAPERDEAPGHFNLLWGADVIALAGHYVVIENDGAYLDRWTLSLSMPPSAVARLDEIKRLVREGMTVLQSGLAERPKHVDIRFDSCVSYEA